jgi:ABC-type Zn uptake system ZnuABC Zn-binding protein ZnuA
MQFPALPSARLLALIALLLAPSLVSCGNPASPNAGGGGGGASGKPIVLCTIFSYYDAARAIAGDAADVQILLPANTSPHEYQQTAQNKFTAERARLFVKNGSGLDDRFDTLIPKSARTLSISQAIPKSELLEGGSDHADHAGHDHADEMNPHFWLDPTIQMKAAEKIRDALVELLPDRKTSLEANATEYIDELKALDAEFKTAAATFKSKEFIGFHSAYDYLARRYGLKQIAAIEENAGGGLTPQNTTRVINLIKQHNIKYIAVETALAGAGAQKIKQDTGVETVVLQPLETYENLNDTYISLMRKNLEALKKILGTTTP